MKRIDYYRVAGLEWEPLAAMSLRYAAWEPPIFAKQSEHPLYSNEHSQYVKMCLRSKSDLFKLSFKFK